jgi:hypothetical protein
MLLDERDLITTPLIQQILFFGMAGLTPIQQDLLGGFFLARIKAPMHCFKLRYAMSSAEIHAEIGDAFAALRHHFKRCGISRSADFCTS